MKIADLYAEIRATGLERLVGSLKVMHTALKRANMQMEKIARLARRVFLVSVGAIALAVREAAKFEKQLAMVSTMLGKTTMRYMAEYEKGLRGLSKEFGESTATLSKGLYDILSASIEPAKAMEVLRVSAKSAVAGFTSTAVSADAITTILNSYGMSADKAGEISDKLFATVLRGKLTFEELASSIGKAAATSAVSGLSLDEMLASIATITRAGIGADQAMTAVVGTLRSFLKPTTEATKMAAELGFEMNTATLRAIGFSGVFAKINKLSAEQLAVLFPNIRGLKGVAAAMQDMTGLGIDLNLMLNSAGLTQEAFGKASDTLSFKLGQMKQEFFALLDAIGKELMPAIKDIAQWFSQLAKVIELNRGKVVQSIITFLKWAAGISVVVMALKVLFSALVAITAHPIIAIITVISAAIIASIEWGSVIDSLKSKMWSFVDVAETAEERIKRQNDAITDWSSNLRSVVSELAGLQSKTSRTADEEMRMIDLTRQLNVELPSMGGSLGSLGKDSITAAAALAEVNKQLIIGMKLKYGEQLKSIGKEVGKSKRDLEHLEYLKEQNQYSKEQLQTGEVKPSPKAERIVFEKWYKPKRYAAETEEHAKWRQISKYLELEDKSNEAIKKKKEEVARLTGEYGSLEKKIETITSMEAKIKVGPPAVDAAANARQVAEETKRVFEIEKKANADLIYEVQRLKIQFTKKGLDQEMALLKAAWAWELKGVEETSLKKWGIDEKYRTKRDILLQEEKEQTEAKIKSLKEGAAAAAAKGGQWTGFADIYRQIQSAVLGPEKISKKQLAELVSANTYLKKISEQQANPVLGP